VSHFSALRLCVLGVSASNDNVRLVQRRDAERLEYRVMTQTFDVAVIGAGVFGAWSAYQLRQAGATVTLIDAYGAGNSRSSSGGESRIIRMGYGPDHIYTRSAFRSLKLWQELLAQRNKELFRATGVLWVAKGSESYSQATLKCLKDSGVQHERLELNELTSRYPQLKFGPEAWGILETNSGVLLARQAVQAVVSHGREIGVSYELKAIVPPTGSGRLTSVASSKGEQIQADKFVFACGPWLPKLFPTVLEGLIHVTRQEVFFLGVPSGDTSFDQPKMPAWIDFNDFVYSIPNIDGRGFKIAIDAHGSEFDPDSGDRLATTAGAQNVRDYLGQRVPALARAPIVESRVCQYENTSNGDFLIDRHPDFENVWLVGGGSGHGFKHGPAVGEYVMQMISGKSELEPRFGLSTKHKHHERAVY
jgi:sarcosine oxidase